MFKNKNKRQDYCHVFTKWRDLKLTALTYWTVHRNIFITHAHDIELLQNLCNLCLIYLKRDIQ